MPLPARQVCDYPNCNVGPPEEENGPPTPFITTQGLQTRAEVNEELKNHVDRRHLYPIEAQKAQALIIQAEASKIIGGTQKILAEQQISRDTSPASGDTNPTSDDAPAA